MTGHVRLYAKPTKFVCLLALGAPTQTFVAGAAYTGYMPVTGQDGRVDVVDVGPGLPAGASVFYDVTNSRVVVTWPKAQDVYETLEHHDTPNLDLEGDESEWDLGAGLSIVPVTYAPSSAGSAKHVRYINSGGESEMVSKTFVPVRKDAALTASVNVQQGASSKGHAGGAVRLKFFDADKKPLNVFTGGFITSNKNSSWKRSSVSVPAPADGYVKLGAAVFRKKENRELFLDDFLWTGATDVPVDPHTIGSYSGEPVRLSVKIRDEKGCQAVYNGWIAGGDIYLTSLPYAVELTESVSAAGALHLGNSLSIPVISASASGSMISADLSVTVAYIGYAHPGSNLESVSAAGDLTGALVTATTSYVSYSNLPDSASASGSLTGATLAVTTSYVNYTNGLPDSISASGQLTGATLA